MLSSDVHNVIHTCFCQTLLRGEGGPKLVVHELKDIVNVHTITKTHAPSSILNKDIYYHYFPLSMEILLWH